ncbi:MAG: hypothetical protein WKF60_10020 [Ilumatobacter sp.]
MLGLDDPVFAGINAVTVVVTVSIDVAFEEGELTRGEDGTLDPVLYPNESSPD